MTVKTYKPVLDYCQFEAGCVARMVEDANGLYVSLSDYRKLKQGTSAMFPFNILRKIWPTPPKPETIEYVMTEEETLIIAAARDACQVATDIFSDAAVLQKYLSRSGDPMSIKQGPDYLLAKLRFTTCDILRKHHPKGWTSWKYTREDEVAGRYRYTITRLNG